MSDAGYRRRRLGIPARLPIATILAALCLPACGDDDVTAATCAELWNAQENQRNRAAVQQAAMRVATITTFRDGGSNTGDPACAAMFRAGPRDDWVLFAATDNAGGSLAWENEPTARGTSFGRDSPEGSGQGAREATVSPSGGVDLQ